MALAISGLVRVQDMVDYGSALTWAGLQTFNAGLAVASGQVATIERINAVDGDGLALYDDGGNLGVIIKDGGSLIVNEDIGLDQDLVIGDSAGHPVLFLAESSSQYGRIEWNDEYLRLGTRRGAIVDETTLVLKNGLVGINETAPGAQLHVKSSGAAVIGQIIELAATPTANAFEINTNGAGGGDLVVVDASGKLGINATTPAGKAHIDQPSDTGAIPVLVLDQADISEGFINFIGSDRGVITGATNSVASVRAELGGTVYRLALYADA